MVRVSGPDATQVLSRVAPALSHGEPRRARLAAVRHPDTGELLDRAVIVVHPGPGRSYTGEDLIEISGHGGWLGPALVLEACIAAGARAATPGEFTRRTYLNGRIDLVQAEAVADLVGGRSTTLRRTALHQFDRGLSSRVGDLREALVGLGALLVQHSTSQRRTTRPFPSLASCRRRRRWPRGCAACLRPPPRASCSGRAR